MALVIDGRPLSLCEDKSLCLCCLADLNNALPMPRRESPSPTYCLAFFLDSNLQTLQPRTEILNLQVQAYLPAPRKETVSRPQTCRPRAGRSPASSVALSDSIAVALLLWPPQTQPLSARASDRVLLRFWSSPAKQLGVIVCKALSCPGPGSSSSTSVVLHQHKVVYWVEIVQRQQDNIVRNRLPRQEMLLVVNFWSCKESLCNFRWLPADQIN